MPRKISIPHVAWRNGRPRFVPSTTLRNQGHQGHDLKNEDGSWMSEGQALDWSRAFARKIREDRHQARNVRQMQAEMRAGPLAKSYTVADMMTDWLGSVQVMSKAANTIRDYRQKTRVLEDFHLWVERADAGELKKDEKPPTLKDRAIAAIWSMEAAGLNRPICANLYQDLFRRRRNFTANAVMTVLGMAIEHAQDMGKIPEARNPAHKMKKVTPRAKPRFGTPDEIEALIAAADTIKRPEIGDMVALGVWIGQRQGDRLALTQAQLQGARFVVTQSKTDAMVSVPIAPRLERRLKAAAVRRKRAKVVNPLIVMDEKQWKPWKADHYRHTFAEVRLEAAKQCPSVLKLRDKDMRATAVIWLAQAQCTPTQIASITGHTLVTVNAILKHYWAATAAQADDAIAKLVAWHQTQGA